jgi:hypothetical protein
MRDWLVDHFEEWFAPFIGGVFVGAACMLIMLMLVESLS